MSQSEHQTLGFLETELSMGYMERFLEKEKRTAAISTVLIIGLIIIVVSVFLIFYVDKPIRKLISTMEEVEKGNFDHRTIISSSNEMRILSQSFNRMVERFRDMMEPISSMRGSWPGHRKS